MSLDTYNEFLRSKITQIFDEDEAEKYAEESEKQRPTVIRTNTLLQRPKMLKTLLSARGVELSPLDWCDTAFVVYNSKIPIGATPEFLAGHYAIQSASSLLPVIALDVKEGMVCADFCAAPGGKTSFIAAFLRGTGTLFAIDVSAERMTGLKSNLQRMGVVATLFCKDARKIELKKMDRILLDAPCSGTGVVSKDPSVKFTKNELDLRKITCLQKELIKKAFSTLKDGGILVYSTCSILVEENEEVIDYLVKREKNAVILEGPAVGRNGIVEFDGKVYDKNMENCRRIFPHVHNMDGFFICKILKKVK